jgi:hypothetical protein
MPKGKPTTNPDRIYLSQQTLPPNSIGNLHYYFIPQNNCASQGSLLTSTNGSVLMSGGVLAHHAYPPHPGLKKNPITTWVLCGRAHPPVAAMGSPQRTARIRFPGHDHDFQMRDDGDDHVFKLYIYELHVIFEDYATERKNRCAWGPASCDHPGDRKKEDIPIRS